MNEETRRILEICSRAFTQKIYVGLCSRNALDGYPLINETVNDKEMLIAYEENENYRPISRFYAYFVAVYRYKDGDMSYYDLNLITRYDASIEALTISVKDIAKRFIEYRDLYINEQNLRQKLSDYYLPI